MVAIAKSPRKSNALKSLTPNQLNFVIEWLKDFNGTKAAQRAGYGQSSENAAAVAAHELLRNPKISRALAQECEKRHLTEAVIKCRLADLGMADMSWFWNTDGTPNMEAMAEKGYCIKKRKFRRWATEHGSSEEYEIELHDPIKPLELICRSLGMLKDKVEVSADSTFTDIIKALRDKVNEKPVKQLADASKCEVVDVQAVPADTGDKPAGSV